MTDQCPRCGLTRQPDAMTRCAAGDTMLSASEAAEHAHSIIACRDRELANLHAYIRSLTVRLERIGTTIGDLLEELG